MARMRVRRALACAVATLATVTLTAAASAAVPLGWSGWRWGSPLPQGNTIRAMSFAGIQGFASGDAGTLLHTTDGGATWTGLRSGMLNSLTQVQAIDGDSLFVGAGCVALRSDDGGATFRRLAFGPVEACPAPIVAGWFVDEATGYLVLADGTVLRTSDDGDTFARRTSVPGTYSLGAGPTDVVFTTDLVGVVGTPSGDIYLTRDGADSWMLAASVDRPVRSMSFVDASHGFAAGDAGLLLSVDGGASWQPVSLAAIGNPSLGSARCATTSLCVATTEDGRQLVRVDLAEPAPTLVTAGDGPVFAAAFASPTRVVVGGASGAMAVSEDAGRTFASVGGGVPGRLLSVRAGPFAGTAYAWGYDGALAKTVDGGATWMRGGVATSADVRDVSFATGSDGFALDFVGGLFRTDDGGSTWQPLDPASTAKPTAVEAISSTTVLLAGPFGVRRSTDGGETFEAVADRAVSHARLNAFDRVGRTIVASGPRAVLRTSDDGRTWRAVRRPSRSELAYAVDFVTARTGWWLGRDGRVFRTTDGGRRWVQLLGVATDHAFDIAFSSAERGYLVVDNDLLRTTDAGATWHPQGLTRSVDGIATGRGEIDYMLSGESALLSTRTGGDSGLPSILTLRARTRLTRPARVVVTGRLVPASGNESVSVMARVPGPDHPHWAVDLRVHTSADGSFTVSLPVDEGTTTFVAQWAGDSRSAGAGSAPLNVRVGVRP